jgi:hypothetical protein
VKFLGVAAMLAGCGRIGFEPPDTNACPPGLEQGPFSTDFAAFPAWSSPRTTTPAIAMSVASSELVVDLPDSTAGEAYALFDSGATRHDATHRVLRARVLEVPTLILGTEALLAWYDDENNKAAIGLVNGELIARVTTGGVTTGPTEPFPAVLEPWWQLVSDGAVLDLEVSSDGIEWRTLFTTEVPPYFTTVRPTLAAGTTRAVAGPGRARFDLLLDCQ